MEGESERTSDVLYSHPIMQRREGDANADLGLESNRSYFPCLCTHLIKDSKADADAASDGGAGFRGG